MILPLHWGTCEHWLLHESPAFIPTCPPEGKLQNWPLPALCRSLPQPIDKGDNPWLLCMSFTIVSVSAFPHSDSCIAAIKPRFFWAPYMIPGKYWVAWPAWDNLCFPALLKLTNLDLATFIWPTGSLVLSGSTILDLWFCYWVLILWIHSKS